MPRISSKEMYNPEIKEDYLSTLDGYPDKGTAKTYRYAFYRSFSTEDTLERDLYTFNTDEVIDALRNADHTTYSSLKTTFSAWKSYITWAATKGYSYSNINNLDSVPTDELRNLVDTNKKLYISSKTPEKDGEWGELEEIESNLENYQDIVILRLLFEGVHGFESSEILNLQKQDINWDSNILHLKDDKFGERDVKVSDKCMEYIGKALDEKEYKNKNGTSAGRWASSPLVENDYIVKTVARNISNFSKADKHTVFRRVKVISEFFDLSYLNAKRIEKSGMLYMAKELYLEEHELTNKQLEKIAERFGMRKMDQSGYQVYNYNLLKFINAENIKKLYNIDIK